MSPFSFVAVIAAGVVACHGRGTNQTFAEASQSVVSENLAAVALTEDEPFARFQIVLGDTVYLRGLDARSDNPHFGVLTQGILLAGGAALVVDASNQEILGLSPAGDRIESVMPHGAGPNEVTEPTSLGALSESTAVVWDNALLRRTTVQGGPDSIWIQATSRVRTMYSQVCAMDPGRLYAVEYDVFSERWLHAIDSLGNQVSSAGLPFREGTNAVNQTISQGDLECVSSVPSLVFVWFYGRLRGISGRRFVEVEEKCARVLPNSCA